MVRPSSPVRSLPVATAAATPKTDAASVASVAAADTGKLGTRKVPRSERMAQILVVAGRIFAQRGFHAASMEDIAKGAGVTKPLLYRYFGSKDALYLATIEQVGQYMMHGLQVLMANPDPSARLEQMLMSFLTFVERHRDGWSVLYNETLGTVGPVGERVAFFRKAFIDAVSHSISEWMGASDKSDPLQADCLAHGIVGAGEALARWWVSHSEVSIQDMQARFRQLVGPALDQLKDSA